MRQVLVRCLAVLLLTSLVVDCTTPSTPGGPTDGPVSGTGPIVPDGARLVFVTPPRDATADESQTVVARVEDAAGVPLTLMPEITLSAAGVAVKTRSTSAGVEVDLQITVPGTYSLTATTAGLASVSSNPFVISAGAPHHLAFVNEPLTARAGTSLAAVSVAVEDAYGNGVSTSVPITLALAGGSTGALLNGTIAVAASAGVSVFADLSVSRGGVSYTLLASCGALGMARCAPFDVTPGSPHHLSFNVQPPAGPTRAGVPFAAAVRVEDSSGDPSPDAATVSLELINGGAAMLAGGSAVAASAGVASFSALSLDKPGSAYVLRAKATGLADQDSTVFAIRSGFAAALSLASQPVAGPTPAGMSLGSISVEVRDAFGTLVEDDGVTQVSLALVQNPVAGTLSGGGASTAQNGVATFLTASVDRTGTGYTLRATAPSLTASAESAPFAITFGAPHHVSFLAAPTGAVAGETFGASVVVLDAYDNLVADDTTTAIALSLGGGPGPLSGPTGATASSGVASFSSLALAIAAPAYHLQADSSGLGGGSSADFAVTHAAAAALAFAQQPSNTELSTPITPAPAVRVVDAYGNTVTSGPVATTGIGLAYDFAATAPSGVFAVSGGDPVAAASGVATFANVVLDTVNDPSAGHYRLIAQASGFAQIFSDTFDVTFGPNRVCYVQNTASPGGNGSLATPFVSLADTMSPSYGGPCVVIRLRYGNATPLSTVGFALAPGQTLERDAADPNLATTLAVGGSITLADGVTVRGPFAIPNNANSGRSLIGTDIDGLTVENVVLADAQGIVLSGTTTGIVSVSNVQITVTGPRDGINIAGSADVRLHDVSITTTLNQSYTQVGGTLRTTGTNVISHTNTGRPFFLQNVAIGPGGAAFTLTSNVSFTTPIQLTNVTRAPGGLTFTGSITTTGTAIEVMSGDVDVDMQANVFGGAGANRLLNAGAGHAGSVVFNGATTLSSSSELIRLQGVSGTYLFNGPLSASTGELVISSCTNAQVSFGPATSFGNTRLTYTASTNTSVTLHGTLSRTISPGQGINATNNTGGSLTVTGAVSLDGGGASALQLSGSGFSVSMTGPLALVSSAGALLVANGLASLTLSHPDNTATSTGGGISITNSTISPAGVRFKSFTSTNAASPLTLANTGTGPFVLSQEGPPGSAGALSNCGAKCVDLSGEHNVTLDNVDLSTSIVCVDSANGRSLVLRRARLTSCTTGVRVVNLADSLVLEGNTIDGSTNGATVTGGATPLALTLAPFDTALPIFRSISGDALVLVPGEGGIDATLDGLQSLGVSGRSLIIDSSAASGTSTFFVSNAVFSPYLARSGGGLSVVASGGGTTRVRFDGAAITGVSAANVGLVSLSAAGNAVLEARLSDNTITDAGDSLGVHLRSREAAKLYALVADTTVRSGKEAVRFDLQGDGVVSGDAELHVELTGTTAVTGSPAHNFGPNALDGLGGVVGVVAADGASDAMCVSLHDNSVGPSGLLPSYLLQGGAGTLEYTATNNASDLMGTPAVITTAPLSPDPQAPTLVPALVCTAPSVF